MLDKVFIVPAMDTPDDIKSILTIFFGGVNNDSYNRYYPMEKPGDESDDYMDWEDQHRINDWLFEKYRLEARFFGEYDYILFHFEW